MAFLCPVRIRRNKKKHGFESTDLLAGTTAVAGHSNTLNSRKHDNHHHPFQPMMGRITGSASIETLVRVGIEKEHGLSPDSKMLVLHDFTPLVDDELEVHRGQVVNILYQENDWVYVISPNEGQEGFIPFSYCAPYEALTFKRKMPRSGPGSVVSGLGGGGGGGGGGDKIGGGSCIEFNEMPVDVGGCDLAVEAATSLKALEKKKMQHHNDPFNGNGHFYDSSSFGIDHQNGTQGTGHLNNSANLTSANVNSNNTPENGGSSSVLPDVEASIVSACSNNGHLGSSNISSLHNNPFQEDQNHQHDINGNTNGLPFFPNTKKLVDGTSFAKNISNIDGSYRNFLENFNSNNSNTLNHDLFSSGQFLDPLLATSFAELANHQLSHHQQQLGEQQIFFKDAIGRFIVLYPFTACDEDEINVERGEVVTLLNKDDPDWCWVVRSDGQEGFVPGLYICPTEMLYNAHHNMMLANQQNIPISASEVLGGGGGGGSSEAADHQIHQHQNVPSVADGGNDIAANSNGQTRVFSTRADEPAVGFKGIQSTTADTGYLSASASQVGLPISATNL